MNKFKELNKRVVQWADNKGILQKATPSTQIEKTIEEVLETKEAILEKEKGNDTYINSKGILKDTEDEILDGFGDTLVTVLIGCEMQNINPLDALESALNIIEKRKGKMIDGTFVKE